MRSKIMEEINQQNFKKNYLLVLIIICSFIFLLFLGILILSKNNLKKELSTTNQSEIVTSYPRISPSQEAKKFLKLTLSSLQKTFSLNDQINIEVYADSEGKNITGYDLVISYDPQVLKFINANSTLDDFSLYSFKKTGYVALTASKKLSSNNQTIFSSTRIANLSFKAIKSGKHTILLEKNLGKEQTQMIDDQTNIYIPSLNQLEIEVK